MKTLSDWNKGDARTRKMVETVFSQLEDHFLMKRNYGKSGGRVLLGFQNWFSLQMVLHAVIACLMQSIHMLILAQCL